VNVLAVKIVKKDKKEVPVEKVVEKVDKALENVSELSTAEHEALQEDIKKDKAKVASTVTLEKALLLVAKRFNLGDDFVMTAFTDAGIRCSLTMSNKDFEVTVKVKDTEKHGLLAVEGGN
jgi:hypothetical protein